MQGQFSGRRQDYRMAPLPKRGFKQPALYRGKKPRTPSRNSISPITQPPPGPPPRNSDPAASNIDLLLGRSYPNDAGSEDGCYSDDEIEDDDTDVKAYDAGPYEGIESIPSITDYRLGREASAKFIRSRLGLDDMDFMWVGKKLLGQGNFGAAGLWEKYDMEGNVVDVAIPTLHRSPSKTNDSPAISGQGDDKQGKVETEHAEGSQDHEGDEQNRLSIDSEIQELPTVSSSTNPSDLYGILSVR